MRIIVTVLLIFTFLSSYSQEILDNYIRVGLESNLALQQKLKNIEKGKWEKREALGLFMPDLSFNARYTRAKGGRTIEIPAGDMMNGVYYSLHEITQFMYDNGLTQMVFPDTSIDNQTINFLREKEHETKLRLIQPIFNPQIYYNYKITKQFGNVYSSLADTTKRGLVAEIKKTYASYVMLHDMIDLINRTDGILSKDIIKNEALVDNDALTVDLLYQLRAERQSLLVQKSEAERYMENVRLYFNFLLNRSFDERVEIDKSFLLSLAETDRDVLVNSALSNRAELQLLNIQHDMLTYSGRLYRTNNLPNAFAVVDYGFQGEEYEFTDDADFLMASFVVQWDLFKGFQNHSKVQQALIDQDVTEKRIEEVKRMIELQVLSDLQEYLASVEIRDISKKRYDNATKAFEMAGIRYEEDRLNLSFFQQYFQALSSKVEAEQKYIESRYNLYMKLTELEKSSALYPLHDEED
ncbi:MAG: hypothetical protein C0594_00480 [Marinilabiliales bacterium]|nr:MAG: hypothetical protein C0594_00480 [Marinilabiliales bacterium]